MLWLIRGGKALPVLAAYATSVCFTIPHSSQTEGQGQGHVLLAVSSELPRAGPRHDGLAPTMISADSVARRLGGALPQPILEVIGPATLSDSLLPKGNNRAEELAAFSLDRSSAGLESVNSPFTLKTHVKVTVVAFSSDGKMLAAASGASAQLWNLTSGLEVGSVRFPSSTVAIQHLTFSPDGTLLAVSPVMRGVGLWNIKSMRSVGILRTASDDPRMVFSSAGNLLATFGWSEHVQLWDVASKTVRVSLPTRDVLSCWFLPDAKMLVTASYKDEAVQLWDSSTGQPAMKWHFPQFDLPIFLQYDFAGDRLILSPDAKWLSLLDNKGLSIWDIRSARQLVAKKSSFTNQVFSPNSMYIAAVTDDGLTKLWNAATGVELLSAGGNGNGYDGTLAFSPDSGFLATASKMDVSIWRITPH